MTVGMIYCFSSQTNFLAVLNNNMIKINPADNETYILCDFNMNLFLNKSCLFEKRNVLNSKTIPNDVKSYHKF